MKKRVLCFFLAVVLSFTMLPGLSAFAENGGYTGAVNTETLLLVDADTGMAVYSRNASVVRPMASTTKIMTYILTMESVFDPSGTMMTIKKEPIRSLDGKGASMAGLEAYIGQQLSVLDVLYALMLPSGCDAAIELAVYVSGSEKKFVERMNQRAKELGCTNTNFADSSGLSNGNKTTAWDMYRIAKYALTLPYFHEIVNTSAYALPGASKPMFQTNDLADMDFGTFYYYQYADGIKTGTTSAAGRCLISSAVKGEKRYICVALGGKKVNGANSAMLDSRNLYIWAFENLTDNIEVTMKNKFQSIELGKSVTLGAEANGAALTWTSSDPSVAEVDGKGCVTAHAVGQVKIKATSPTGNFDTCTVSCGFYQGIEVNQNVRDYSKGEERPLDWNALKAAGLDFALICAGTGRGEMDSAFVDNVREAQAAGMPFAPSWSLNAKSEEQARIQAIWLVQQLHNAMPEGLKNLKMPMVCDMVSSGAYTNLSGEEKTVIIRKFNQIMRENGLETLLYAGKSQLEGVDVAQLKREGVRIWYYWKPWIVDFRSTPLVQEVRPDAWTYRQDGYLTEALQNGKTSLCLVYRDSMQLEEQGGWDFWSWLCSLFCWF